LVKKDVRPDTQIDEEAEHKWLTEVEKVESAVFDGKVLAKTKYSTNKDIANEYFGDRADRRVGKNTTVMIDGYAVSKDTVNNDQWVAVQTISSTTRAFAEPKREKKAVVEPQSHCQICMDGGEIQCCQLCPRAYHLHCLDSAFRSKAKGWQFVCPQHECHDCSQKTTDAGGMLFRCRWCERAYCEDCMDWEKFTPFGNNLPEYELLRFPEMTQSFYIQCSACTDHFAENDGDRKLCEGLAEEWKADHERMFAGSTRAGSLTDATTIDTTGVNTPNIIDDDDVYEVNFQGKKRKSKQEETSDSRSFKRERLEVS